MTSRPIDALAVGALVKIFLGFPDVIGYLAVYVGFVDCNNHKVAADTPGKDPDVGSSNTDFTDDLFELFV
jgi:hypothetical protein